MLNTNEQPSVGIESDYRRNCPDREAEAINITDLFDATASQISEHLEVLKEQHVGGIPQ